jgi:hypothetical protein
MDSIILAKVITALETSDEDEDALLTALLLLLAILQQPAAYANPKARPVSEFTDLVHWTMLAFPPISRRLAKSGQIKLSPELTACRELDAEGKFVLRVDGLFPPQRKDEPPSYEYDVCISFAGEQRGLAESLANKLKNEFYLRVFYDDFEKLDLWGRDLFNHLYEVYSMRSQYCIVLFSQDYLSKNWTSHELRAAQSRILKERSPYMLPVLTEPNVKPPIEFENIAYMTLDPADLEPLCSEVNERVWAVRKSYMLELEEMVALINEGFQFELFFSPFRKYMATCTDSGEQMLVFLMGLSWCCSQDKVSNQLARLIEYLLFAFPPVAQRFNDNDEILVIPPDGTIHRVIGRTNGSLLMQKSFWEPIIARWKDDHPLMFGNSGEESDDDVSLDDNSTESAT